MPEPEGRFGDDPLEDEAAAIVAFPTAGVYQNVLFYV